MLIIRDKTRVDCANLEIKTTLSVCYLQYIYYIHSWFLTDGYEMSSDGARVRFGVRSPYAAHCSRQHTYTYVWTDAWMNARGCRLQANQRTAAWLYE